MLALPAPASATHSELAGEWHLDTIAGGTTPDSSGHNLTGTVAGSTALVGGRFGSGLDFPSKPSVVDAGSHAELQSPTVTLLGWVRSSAIPGKVEAVASQGAAGSCDHSSYALYTGGSLDTVGLRFYIWNGSSALISPAASNAMWDGHWHAVAGTYDGTRVRLYVDGQQVGSGTPATGAIGYGLDVNNDFTIGNYSGASTCSEQTEFSGNVDEVRVYNRALDSEEIAYLARADHTTPPELPIPTTTGPSPPPPPGSTVGAAVTAVQAKSLSLAGARIGTPPRVLREALAAAQLGSALSKPTSSPRVTTRMHGALAATRAPSAALQRRLGSLAYGIPVSVTGTKGSVVDVVAAIAIERKVGRRLQVTRVVLPATAVSVPSGVAAARLPINALAARALEKPGAVRAAIALQPLLVSDLGDPILANQDLQNVLQRVQESLALMSNLLRQINDIQRTVIGRIGFLAATRTSKLARLRRQVSHQAKLAAADGSRGAALLAPLVAPHVSATKRVTFVLKPCPRRCPYPVGSSR